jgi:DNA-binding transcriptional MerR regulator
MSEELIHRAPQTVARELDVSLSTLRRWSDEFSAYLSTSAGVAGQAHRRYLESDITTLLTIKNWVNEGMTYEQVHQQLNGQSGSGDNPSPPLPPPSGEPGGPDVPAEEPKEQALVTTGGPESPALAFLTNTLATLSDNQKSILNSQAANRELLGVLLQDNFNLKDENTRLRERILEVEREVAQTRQDEEWRREALRQELDAKIATATQLATQALTAAHSVETPEIRAIESKSGCLGMLLGRGGMQIISLPRRSKGRAEATPPIAASAPSAQPSASSHHPKPMFPPE